MKIRVSKRFAQFINKTAKEMGFECEAEVVSMPLRQYEFSTGGDLFSAMDYNDYDYDTDKLKAIMVTYPCEYYACPQYLTTKGLLKEWLKRSDHSLASLKEMLKELLEI